MDARLFHGAFPAGDPHALWAAAPGSVRAHSLGRDRDGDRLAPGRSTAPYGRASGRPPRSSIASEGAESRIRAVSGPRDITPERRTFADPYVRRTAARG